MLVADGDWLGEAKGFLSWPMMRRSGRLEERMVVEADNRVPAGFRQRCGHRELARAATMNVDAGA
ncbi:hypothetical protein [Dactylosporangium salmoneum]|uniref:hypothetical protein n=1 Tax=Dactylosporangium salmoneum TaxID=53361 RepID=UPI0031D9A524